MTRTSGFTSGSMTHTSALMGSPFYMSPEQMRSSKDVDAQTDIWALGVNLFELMTGRPALQRPDRCADGPRAVRTHTTLPSMLTSCPVRRPLPRSPT
jgi:serine/threonine protein kinase